MKNFSLFSILQCFTEKEIDSFEKFVISPFFNTSKATSLLFHEIKKFYPSFNSSECTKEKLFAVVYNNKPYSNDLYKKLLSNLIKLCHKFIVMQNPAFEEYSLLAGLRKKKLYNSFNLKRKKLNNMYNEIIIDEDYLLNLSFIESENASYLYETDNYVEYELSKEKTFNYDSIFFLYRIAQNFISAKNVAVKNTGNNPGLGELMFHNIGFEELAGMIKNSVLNNKDILYHLVSLPLLNTTRSDKLFREIKEFSYNYSSKHPSSVIHIGYIYLLDFITYKINSGSKEYLYERHDVYKKMENDYYASGNAEISLVQFKNFFLSGIRTGDFKFSEFILNKYIDLLESKGNPGLKKFFLSKLLFHSGKFTESLKVISTFKTGGYMLDDYVLIPDVKVITLQLLFELGYFEQALSAANSFSNFIKKNRRISSNYKQLYGNFNKVYKKLLVSKLNGSELVYKKFNDILKESLICAEKNWLQDKFSIMKNAKRIKKIQPAGVNN